METLTVPGRIAENLLEFQAAPGRFSLAQRQPAPLFQAARQVLLLASGKAGVEPGPWRGRADDVRQAALYFIQTALLRRDADHYSVLAVARSASSDELKDNYRLMMRLTHPDFAPAAGGLALSDAAARVNLAYEVLSSAVKRKLYDQQLDRASQAPRMVMPNALPAGARAGSRAAGGWSSRAGERRFFARRSMATLGLGAGGLAMLIIALSWYNADSGRHVRLAQIKREAVRPVTTPPATPSVEAPPPETSANGADLMVVRSSPPSPQDAAAPVTETARPKPIIRLATAPVDTAVTLPQPAAGRLSRSLESAPLLSARQVVQPDVPVSSVEIPNFAPVERRAEPSLRHEDRTGTAAIAPRPANESARAPSVPDTDLMLASLISQLQTGRATRVLPLLDSGARRKPGVVAFIEQFDAMVQGEQVNQVRLVNFRTQTVESQTFLIGELRVQLRDPDLRTKRMRLQIDVAQQAGEPVITNLSSSRLPD